jgi:hypothetical protein
MARRTPVISKKNLTLNSERVMAIIWNVIRVLIAAVTVVTVAELSKRYPRWGALLLSLPLISILAFLMSWFQYHDMKAISKMARETLVLVPLGLPFFVPFAFATRWGLDFWTSFAAGLLLASFTIGTWMWFAPSA